MSERDQQVRDGDRAAAIRAVEAALAAGQIVQFDRDKRVEQLQHAQTSDEVRMVTHDLEYRMPGPVEPELVVETQPTMSTYEVAEAQPQPTYAQPPYAQPPYGAPSPTATFAARGSSGGGLRVVKIVVPLVLAIVGIGIAAPVISAFNGASDTFNDLFPDFEGVEGFDDFDDFEVGGPGSGESPPDVLSVAGYDDMVAAVRQETGSAEVFEVVVYPEYAVIDVPVDKRSGRERSLFWNGELSESGSKGTTDFDRFDLRDIDPRVMDKLAKRARTLVSGKIESSYVIIHAPGATDVGAWFYVYANNEFSEGGYLSADLKGKIVRRVTS